MANLENLKPFKPGESGNPNGRPPKLVTAVLKALESEGYEGIKRSQVADVYETLLVLPQPKLTALANDADQPMLLRIVAKAMLSNKGFEIIEKMLDRSQGKAQQSVDMTTGGDKLSIALVEFVDGSDKDTDPVS